MSSTPEHLPEEYEILVTPEIVRGDVNQFQQLLDRGLRSMERLIVLDLSQADTLGSAMIGKILRYKRECEQVGKRLVIRHCSREMLELVRMIRLDTLIEIQP